MTKYFLAYAGAGCLLAIALSSLVTEISRLVPWVWQVTVIVWGLSALFFGAWLRSQESKEDLLIDEEKKQRLTLYFALFLLVNMILGLGVNLGIY